MNSTNNNFNDKIKNDLRSILGVKNLNNWIYNINISQVLSLSQLSMDDFVSSTDPMNEIQKDSLNEKFVLISTAYFCMATELRYL